MLIKTIYGQWIKNYDNADEMMMYYSLMSSDDQKKANENNKRTAEYRQWTKNRRGEKKKMQDVTVVCRISI